MNPIKEDKEILRTIHYLEVLMQNSTAYQSEIRDALAFSIKVLSRLDIMETIANNMLRDLKEVSKE